MDEDLSNLERICSNQETTIKVLREVIHAVLYRCTIDKRATRLLTKSQRIHPEYPETGEFLKEIDLLNQLAGLQQTPCACSGPCDEEGLTVTNQCPRCKQIEAVSKELDAYDR
jgi:hypothetical protein